MPAVIPHGVANATWCASSCSYLDRRFSPHQSGRTPHKHHEQDHECDQVLVRGGDVEPSDVLEDPDNYTAKDRPGNADDSTEDRGREGFESNHVSHVEGDEVQRTDEDASNGSDCVVLFVGFFV